MSHTVTVARPQNLRSKSADNKKQPWTHSPGAFPKLDAAVAEHAAVHGTIWSPHLLGPDFISFGDFIRRPELIGLCPVGSDARFALDELQTLVCFGGSRNESKRALTGHIRASALFARRENFRYVQRIFNSIWRNYDGLLEAKAANLQALASARNDELRADERKAKDAARKAASRSADPAVRIAMRSERAERLSKEVQQLRSLAERKEQKAKKWLAQAEALRTKAKKKETEAQGSEQ
ncbi:MAG: hypothetical protein K2Z80_25675 [Xanthobacteraceae bacterium]|nr:hypothetical protein [Xanthobacteraceae bacterium]